MVFSPYMAVLCAPSDFQCVQHANSITVQPSWTLCSKTVCWLTQTYFRHWAFNLTACCLAVPQALVAAREAAPDQWVESERKRLERRATQLDEALAKERKKRLHAARLARALHTLDEQGSGSDIGTLSQFRYRCRALCQPTCRTSVTSSMLSSGYQRSVTVPAFAFARALASVVPRQWQVLVVN